MSRTHDASWTHDESDARRELDARHESAGEEADTMGDNPQEYYRPTRHPTHFSPVES